MTVSIGKTASALALALALAACNNGVNQAMAEMTESCVAGGNGRLTEAECSCVTERAFDQLNAEELEFVGKVYSLPPGTPNDEAAEMLGMDRGEFNRLSRSFAGKLSDGAFGGAMECMAG